MPNNIDQSNILSDAEKLDAQHEKEIREKERICTSDELSELARDLKCGPADMLKVKGSSSQSSIDQRD